MEKTDVKLFYDAPALDHAETEIVEAGAVEGRPFVRLRETIFYPEGGGQPADRGTISGVAVLDVQSRGREVLHFVERPLPLGPAVAVLDAARRLDHRQQHTAQHLLTAVVADRLAMPTISFHLGAEYSSIDVSGGTIGSDALREIEAEVNADIRRDLPVTTRWVEPEEIASLGVRSRGLPGGHTGRVRIVEIEGIDRNTCGGTHVDRLAEIQAIHLSGTESARGGARIFFLAGGRVLSALRDLEGLEAGLKSRIGTGRGEFLTILDSWQKERRKLEKRVGELEGALGERIASDIAREEGSRLGRFLEGASPEQLRAVARTVLEKRPEAVVVLVGGTTEREDASFLVQAGPGGPDDVSATGEALKQALHAKGGGKGRLYQGSRGTWSGDPSLLLRL